MVLPETYLYQTFTDEWGLEDDKPKSVSKVSSKSISHHSLQISSHHSNSSKPYQQMIVEIEIIIILKIEIEQNFKVIIMLEVKLEYEFF